MIFVRRDLQKKESGQLKSMNFATEI